MGIMPSAGKTCFVFHESMYSALPTKLIRRGTVSMRNAESRKLMWFGHRMAGPSDGMRSYPSRWNRQSRLASGAATARQRSWSAPAPWCSPPAAGATPRSYAASVAGG